MGEVIKEAFEISYSVRAVGNLLHDMGFSPQKPVYKSYKQDQAAVEKWKNEQLPAIKKKPDEKDM